MTDREKVDKGASSLADAAPLEAGPATVESWMSANMAQIEAEVARLSLVLHRKILWLRKSWNRDPLQDFNEVISDAEIDRLLARDRWDDERSFYREGPAAELGREIAAQKEKSKLAAQDALTAGSPPAIDILARLFHLDGFDREILLLCLAPELDSAFERIYAYVQDDATRKYPTLQLALSLFGCDFFASEANAWTECSKHFMPDAPLVRSRLLHWELASGAPSASDSIRIERRICDYLLGLNRMDEQAHLLLRPMDLQISLATGGESPSNQLEHLLRQWNGRGRMPAINLVGKPAAARRVAADLCVRRLGIGLYALELLRLPSGIRERRDLLRVLERDAVLLPSAFFLDLTALDKHDHAAVALAQEIILDLRSFLIVASREPWRSERGFVAVEVPKLSRTEQRNIWKVSLGESILADANTNIERSGDDFLETLIQQFDFDAAQIAQVSESAKTTAQLRDPDSTKVTRPEIWRAARAHFSDALVGLAERIVPTYRFADLVLPDDTLQQLREISSQVARRGQVYECWGFGERLSRGRGIAALFAGPSGTGKTMAAESLANALNLDLYRVDLSGVVSKYIGETEKNLRSVFDAAEESGAILFFDEADALFGKRSEIRDSHDRYANIEINYLLQRMENYRGLAVLATNMKTMLDPAFLRRFRFLVEFPFPTPAQRKRIWQGVFPAAAEKDAFDYDFLSRLEITGGNIQNIAINAAFLAAEETKPIGMQHLLAAAKREYSKIDKLVLASEFGNFSKVQR